MAKVFLDANSFIDLGTSRSDLSLDDFLDHSLLVSPVSVHILFYISKYKVPQRHIEKIIAKCIVVELNSEVIEKALTGPTTDFEDNVQLYSAAQSGADFFLTSDKELLKMRFFGTARIANSLED